ncbi:MAG: hypothetical protein ACRYFR_15680 [Janthinobacterium lividum]
MLAPVNLRFAELIQEVGLTKNAFAQSLGKTASVVQHLIDGRNKPGYDLLCKVFEVYPNVSKDWLLEGQGPMLLTGASQAAAAVPPAPAVALKKPAGPPSLFAAQVAEEIPEMPAAGVPAPAATLSVPPAAPVVAAAAPVATPPVGPPAPAPAAPGPAADVAIGAALQTQHLLHQLALAEMRNQHLLEQQQLLRQMLNMAQGR